jgi:hypothetical protein
MTDEQSAPVRFDRVAILAAFALAVQLALLAAAFAYSRMSRDGQLNPLFAQRWFLPIAGGAIALLALALLDMTRQKNVSWRSIRHRYGAPPEAAKPGKKYGAGRGRICGHSYWGLRCFGGPSGLVVARLLSIINRPLFIPWSAIATVEAYPNALTGKAGFENDMEAKIGLRDRPTLDVEVPWLGEYRQLLPKAVKFRATKRPEKAGPMKRERQGGGRRS